MRRDPCSETAGLQRLLLWKLKEKGMHLPAGVSEEFLS